MPAAKAGWKVAMVDVEPYGGTCMLRGCDPKKMLIGVTEGVDWAERMKSKVARVGLLESETADQGLKFDVKFKRTENWYSSRRVGEQFSGYKVLVEQDTNKILGAHLIGPGAEEQINLIAMAMGQGITANQLKGVIFAYPSYASDIGSMV